MNCLRTSCTNARHELTSPMFDLSEPVAEGLASTEGGVSTSLIDVSKTFCPRPHIPFTAAKAFLTAWVIALMALSIEQTQFESFWLAYLTHWGWTVTVAYFLFSLGTACYFSKCEHADGGGGKVVLAKITWSLLAIALPGEVIICLLFWFLEFDGTVQYVSLMLHGIGILLIAIDGFLINRIPLRMKQFVLFEAFAALYLIWNIVFSFSGIGNPYKESGAQDDDAIYSSMRWKTSTSSAVTIAVLVLLVANPILFLLCRAVSRLFPRRLVATETKSGEIELGFSQNLGESEAV